MPLGNEQDDTLKKMNKAKFFTNVTFSVFHSLFLFIVVMILLGGALGVGIGAGYFASLVEDTTKMTREDFDRAFGNVTETSHLAYADGSPIATISSDLLRTTVASDQISDLLKNAIISVEDENFYEHEGFVPKAVLRALISEVTGLGSSGGSTLTQQLIKQQVLTNETTFARKANEILLAADAEKYFSKDEIVTTYLNISPFGRNNSGQNIAGVQEAALGIFGVNASEVTLPQAAFIAGLPQSPIVYSPFTQTGELKEDLSYGLERKDSVLFAMYREKIITEAEYNDAKNYDLTQDFLPQATVEVADRGFLYHSVLDEAIAVLAEKNATNDGLSPEQFNEETNYDRYTTMAEREIENGGYTVTSTIDRGLHDAMESAAIDYGYMLDDGSGETVETGAVLMDNATGRIYAFMGSRDYAVNQNNHALNTRRQAGSTMKPVLAYGPAIDVGMIGSKSMLADYAVNYTDGGKPVNNANGQSGTGTFLTTERALQVSSNVTAFNVYRELLREKGSTSFVYDNYMAKMNFPDLGDWGVEAAPMGTTSVTTLEMVNAYQTLANKGAYQEGYMVESIIDNQGNVIYQHEAAPVQVYSEAAATIMNSLMKSVIDAGITTSFKNILTGLNAPIGSANWAGKTGTTDDNKDSWLIVSTPTVTIGNWSGKDLNNVLYGNTGSRTGYFLAYLVNRLYLTNSEIFGTEATFDLSPDVNAVQVSDVTGLKKGSFTYDNRTYNDPGKEVTSLWTTPNVPNSRYEFGVGGTTANYADYWSKHVKSNKTASSRSTSGNSNSTTGGNTATNDDTDDADTGDDDNETD